MTRWQSVVFLLCLLAAAGVRLVSLDRFPVQVNQDELSNIYDGWSLATTGADRSGRAWPILCYGFGPRDERPALYAWLYASMARWTECSIAAGRSVAGVVGSATLLLAAWWGWKIGRFDGAILSLVAVGFCPWHIVYSRIAHEGASLPPFFAMLIVALLTHALLSMDKVRGGTWRWMLTGLAIGFSTNAYGATRVSALLFAVLAALLLVIGARRAAWSWPRVGTMMAVLVVAVTAGAAPQLWMFFFAHDQFLGRASEVQMHTRGLGHLATRVFSNILANLKPEYLFYKFGSVNNLSVARCSAITLPFAVVGLGSLLLPRTSWRWMDRAVLLSGILICVMPAAFAYPNPHALRSSGVSVLIPLLAVFGILQIQARYPAPKPVSWSSVLVSAMLLWGGWDILLYAATPNLWKSGHQPEVVHMATWLHANDAQYDRVYVENRHLQASLYIAAYGGVSPKEFQSTSRQVWGLDREQFEQFGKYRFTGASGARADWSVSSKKERWLVIATDGTIIQTFGVP